MIEPQRRDQAGRGIYDASTEMIVKELREAGVRASFLDPPATRLFNVQHSAWADLVLAIVINFGSSAAWDGLKALIRKSSPPSRHVSLSLTAVEADGSRRELHASGSGEDVIAVIQGLRERPRG
ncbi:hypothetical protein [Pseudokineococcus sp. 1T1Z-3]|uniref:hypothetical protein n=1 Tax=Pseudokineococcus sp. 1T1Z-3 TaxID=3132745 RepID=UPI0030B155BC